MGASRRRRKGPNPSEAAEVERLITVAEEIIRKEKSARPRLTPLDFDLSGLRAPLRNGGISPGEIFVKSEGYKSLFGSSGINRPQRWSTGPIEVSGPPLQFKGTVGESSFGAYGQALVSVPQVTPGVVSALFQPLSVEQALGSGVATGPTVRYITEGTAESGAAGVAEGGSKPESLISLGYTDEPVKKIATFLPVSDEMLEDAPAIQTYLNNQLGIFVNIEVERQLLRGTAGGNEVQGLLVSRNVPLYQGGTAAGNKAEQLFKAANSMRGSAYTEPGWFIVNPTDYEAIRLLKDSQGQLYGGGPFFGPYGAGAAVAASGQVTGVIDTLWGKPTYVTSALGPGTALVGSRAGASVFSRGGLTVEASNSHSTFFQQDLVAIRAERRLGLCVYRSKSFVEVRLA